jgi:hypothetical protein
MTYIAIYIQDIKGNIYYCTGEMKLAIEFLQTEKLTQIDQHLVPEISEDGDFTGENIIVITVGE